MTLSIRGSSVPSPSNSPSSSEEYNLPCTPDSPTMSQPESSAQEAAQQPPSQSSSSSTATHPGQQPQSNNNNSATASTVNGQAKRKPSRRANTAERRATHNAVERQRRETLNGRFLVSAILICHMSSSYSPDLIARIGSGRSLAEPFPDQAPVQVLHRKLLHRPHQCVPSPPHGRISRASFAEERS
jgi:hypothetical protein